MSLLGKILLFVNLVAAIGLAYLTTQDWSKRQEITALGLRYQLVLVGMPVEEPKDITAGENEIALGIEDTPGHITTTVPKKLLSNHFGGEPPKSQVEEVRALQKRMTDGIAGMADEPAKLRYICGGLNPQGQFEPGVLLRFADTFEERQAIRTLALTRNPALVAANVTDARRRLDRKFESAINPPNLAAAQADAQKIDDLRAKIAGGDAKAAEELNAIFAEGNPGYSKDDIDRRNRIAQILMLSNIDVNNQKKTILIVGLRTYVRALNEQLARMEEVVRRVERLMEQDQARFQEEYELLKRLAVEQDQLLFQQQRIVAGMKDQAAEDDKHVQVRQTQLNNLETNLKDVSDAVAQLLQSQAVVEKSLFEVQKKVGETLDRNIRLENKLLKTEEAQK